MSTAPVAIDVVLPVLDEALAIPRVLDALPPGYTPIIVDNGSTDGSAHIARELGARVVVEPRRGFGSACFAGLCAATAPFVCFMDCDGSLDPADLVRVATPVLRGDRDLVLGARRAGPHAWPVHSRLANRVLAGMLRSRGAELSDLGPMRAAGRHELLRLDVKDRRSGWPLEMVLRAARAGWRIDEVPVSYGARVGSSKVTGTPRGTVTAIRDMAQVLTTC